jgi:hypothetical protein
LNWREWLGLEKTTEPGQRTEVVAGIAQALDGLPPERARFVAAFAYHLGRIAHADDTLTDAERDTIRTLVVQ